MNKLTVEEIKTIEAYDRNAAGWVSSHDTDNFYDEEYKIFNKFLPNGKILEIGSGSGRDATRLLALGYSYVGIDPAKKLLQIARKREPNAEFLINDIYSMKFKHKFDGFWCTAVVLHIPRIRIVEALSLIAAQIKTNGIGFITTKQGTSDMLAPYSEGSKSQRLQVHYTKEEFDEALNKAGFKIIKYVFRPLSERSRWMCYFVRKI